MAGSEQLGVDGRDADLFEGAVWVLTPVEGTDTDGLRAGARRSCPRSGPRSWPCRPSATTRSSPWCPTCPHLTAAALMEHRRRAGRGARRAAAPRRRRLPRHDPHRRGQPGHLARHLRGEPRRHRRGDRPAASPRWASCATSSPTADATELLEPGSSEAQASPAEPARPGRPTGRGGRDPRPGARPPGRPGRGHHPGQRARRQHRRPRDRPLERGRGRRADPAGRHAQTVDRSGPASIERGYRPAVQPASNDRRRPVRPDRDSPIRYPIEPLRAPARRHGVGSRARSRSPTGPSSARRWPTARARSTASCSPTTPRPCSACSTRSASRVRVDRAAGHDRGRRVRRARSRPPTSRSTSASPARPPGSCRRCSRSGDGAVPGHRPPAAAGPADGRRRSTRCASSAPRSRSSPAPGRLPATVTRRRHRAAAGCACRATCRASSSPGSCSVGPCLPDGLVDRGHDAARVAALRRAHRPRSWGVRRVGRDARPLDVRGRARRLPGRHYADRARCQRGLVLLRRRGHLRRAGAGRGLGADVPPGRRRLRRRARRRWAPTVRPDDRRHRGARRTGALRGRRRSTSPTCPTPRRRWPSWRAFADGPTRDHRHRVHPRARRPTASPRWPPSCARCGIEVVVERRRLDDPPRHRCTPATVDTYDDHRMAMSFALLGLRRRGIAIADPGCVAKTFPGFWAALEPAARHRGRPEGPGRLPIRMRVIAIDGPAGSGKSTVARRLADAAGPRVPRHRRHVPGRHVRRAAPGDRSGRRR